MEIYFKKIFILQREGKTSPPSPPHPFLDIQADRFNGVNNLLKYQWVCKITIISHHRFQLYYLTVDVGLKTDKGLLERFLEKNTATWPLKTLKKYGKK